MTRRPHVLVTRLDNAGDVLLTGPTTRSLADHGARVTFLAGPAGVDAATMLPGVDDVIVYDAPWVGYAAPRTDARGVDALVGDVQRRSIDEAIVLTSFHQSALPLALLLRLAGVARISAISEDYPGSLLDVRVADPGDVNEVERAFAVAQASGLVPTNARPGRLAVRGPLPVSNVTTDPFVVVHPGASVEARAIRGARAADAVRALRAAGRVVVVTGGRDEIELAHTVAGSRDPGVHVAAPAGDLRALAGLLATADAVVCANTGPAHLAAAVGTPVVSVFAPVVPVARWRPWGVPHVVLGDLDIECAGCRARVCPLPGQPCVAPVDGAAIARAVEVVARSHRAGASGERFEVSA